MKSAAYGEWLYFCSTYNRCDSRMRVITMGDYLTILNQLKTDVRQLQKEASLAETHLFHANLDESGCATVLYGLIMSCFAIIDVAASYWRGDTGSKHQTKRMVDFMCHFLSASQEAAFISIRMWRHTLMHTSKPRDLLYRDDKINVKYSWLMHWGSLLPRDDHLKVKRCDSPSKRKIQLALTYLIEDVISALDKMTEEAASDLNIQDNIVRTESAITGQTFKPPEYISNSNFT